MTNQPPSNPRPSPREWDEFIAVVVALTAIGSLLFWGLNRKPDRWGSSFRWFNNQTIPTPSPSPTGLPTPQPTPASPMFPMFPTPAPLPLSPGTTPPSPGAVAPASPPPSVPTVPLPAPVAPRPTVTPALLSPFNQAPTSFADVPADYWAAPFITALAQRGAMSASEMGRFEPERPVTRAEYAIAIERLLPLGEGQNPLGFKDVPPNSTAIAAIDAAVRGGYLKGYPDGLFRPDQPIPRYQVYLSLANGIQAVPPANAETVLSRFSDRDQIPAYAVPAIAAATQAGLVVNPGDPQALEPTRPMTRAEVATSIYQALVALGQVPPIESPKLVRP
ncbi:MAG TPA: S-layer homology domain-containing protein [Synechococcales cyanobacterium M55_K2018_004]|nr:S-layer homology domain-containing protein [Synechococcales cyanobacterium M55_K2018_004]